MTAAGPLDAIELPCRECGAPLPIDLGAGSIHCAFCNRGWPLDGPEIQRVRAHLAGLEEKRAAFNESAGEVAPQRRQRSPIWHLVLALSYTLPIGAGVALQAAGGPAWLEWLVIASGFALWAVTIHLMLRRRKMHLRLPTLSIRQAQCDRCGARVPVVAGEALRCPFCRADLLPAEATTREIERAADAHVRQESQLAQAERDATYERNEQLMNRSRRGARYVWVVIPMLAGAMWATFTISSGSSLEPMQQQLVMSAVAVAVIFGVISLFIWSVYRR